jgi:hypothetical protein
MTKTEQNIEVILNSLMVIEAKLDALVDKSFDEEEMTDFNEKFHLHIQEVRERWSTS